MDPTPLATQVKSVCCVGAGYVGGPSMAVFAKNCPDLHIVVADTNRRRIDAWNSNMYDIAQPAIQLFFPHKFCRGSFLALFRTKLISCDNVVCRLPIYEPGLDDVVQKVRGKNLHFTWNVSKAISDSQLVFVCVNTPSKTRGTFGVRCN
jgi:UDPglucose 6-dehydrogenase